MSATGGPAGGQPSQEELRAAYEAEIKKIRVEHVLLENIVTMVNLGMRRTGLSPGTESERDLGQVKLAIESIRTLLPLLEPVAPSQVGPIRDALSQLQLAFVRIGGQAPAETGERAPAAGPPPSEPGASPPGGEQGAGQPASGSTEPDQPGPAQRSGRLWIPGQ
jgi:hypothetical protein